MTATAIERTKKLAKRARVPDTSATRERMHQLDGAQRKAQEFLGALLGVEEAARRQINSRVSELRSEHSRLEVEIRRANALKPLSEKYQRLSLTPLSWRDRKGYPKLAVFTLQSSTFRISTVYETQTGYVRPALPRAIAECYDDIPEVLRKQQVARSSGRELTISCEFSGLIPREVKEKIAAAKEDFGDKIFIVAEPGAWSLQEIVRLPDGDPLVVGYSEAADPNALWLIADFDTTPVEQAMIFHFDDTETT